MADNVLNPVTPLIQDGSGGSNAVGPSHPMPVTMTSAVGAIVWTRTSVTLDGSSDTALAANATRKGLIVSNRVGNAQISYSIAGGTVTLINGIPLLAGARDAYTDEATPLTAITVIGTNTQICDFWEGN